MTEDEAKTKWCPYAQRQQKFAKCLGSECMAWRWDNPPDELRYMGWTEDQFIYALEHTKHKVGIGRTELRSLWHKEHVEEPPRTVLKNGYCGLACKL